MLDGLNCMNLEYKLRSQKEPLNLFIPTDFGKKKITI